MKHLPFIVGVLALGFSACKKTSEDIIYDTERTSSNHIIQAQELVIEAVNFVNEAYNSDTLAYYGSNTNVNVSRNTLTTTRTINIDFSFSNQEGRDSKNRRGRITASYVDGFNELQNNINIRFDNYYVDDNRLQGYVTLKYVGNNSAGDRKYSISSSSVVLNKTNGDFVTFDGLLSSVFEQGYSSNTMLDDRHRISGLCLGTVKQNGQEYDFSAEITSPLAKRSDANCNHFTEGKMTISIANKPERSADFGSGSCDNDVTYTIEGKQYYDNLY